MKVKSAKCPNCGSKLRKNDDTDMRRCSHCGSDIYVMDASQATDEGRAKVENLVRLGKIELTNSNGKAADKYFSMVLEREFENVDAWIGKGLACVLKENDKWTDCFDRALSFSKAKETDTNRLVNEAIEYCSMDWDVYCCKYLIDLEPTDVATRGSLAEASWDSFWNELELAYIDKCISMSNNPHVLIDKMVAWMPKHLWFDVYDEILERRADEIKAFVEKISPGNRTVGDAIDVRLRPKESPPDNSKAEVARISNIVFWSFFSVIAVVSTACILMFASPESARGFFILLGIVCVVPIVIHLLGWDTPV